MANEKRLIDANALKADLRESYEELQKIREGLIDDRDILVCNGEISSLLGAIFSVRNAPTVDAVKVVHGRWIDNIDDKGVLCNAWRKCSACGGLNYSKRPPYCPNCGAKMDGDGNG